MIKGRIGHAERCRIKFGPYEGEAGLAIRDGKMQLAFRFTGSVAALKATKRGTIAGQAYALRGVAESQLVPGMIVLSVEKA